MHVLKTEKVQVLSAIGAVLAIVIALSLLAKVSFLPSVPTFIISGALGIGLVGWWACWSARYRRHLSPVAFALAATSPPNRVAWAFAWVVASVLVLGGLLGFLLSMLMAIPVYWLAQQPYRAVVSLDAQYRMRGFHSGMSQLSLRSELTGETFKLSWAREAAPLFGNDSYPKGSQLLLCGRTSWFGVVIESVSAVGMASPGEQSVTASQSIERTCHGRLRLSRQAAHVES